MKIFLPFAIKDIGGTSTFARKFKAGMEAAGHTVTYDYTPDYDVLFLIVQCPLKYLIDAKRRGKKIVQRLDGTYYWSVSGWKFPLMNAKATYIRQFFTDYTIYQSKYSQDCANRFLGKKRRDRHSVIYNGVDLSQFSHRGPKALKRKGERKIFFTASAFRRQDQIQPILDALDHYERNYDQNFHCYIAGTFRGRVANLPEKLKDIPYITLLGKVDNAKLANYERSADVFLFTHLNPPCPNNIIEALACGLPICGVADGAMPEIVTQGRTGFLISSPGTGFWKPRQLDVAKLAATLEKVISKPNLSTYCRQTAEQRFSLIGMIDAYVKVFEEVSE